MQSLKFFLILSSMQLLYYLLLFVLGISVLAALLIASGVLHISVHNTSERDDLPEDIRKLLDDDEEDKEE